MHACSVEYRLPPRGDNPYRASESDGDEVEEDDDVDEATTESEKSSSHDDFISEDEDLAENRCGKERNNFDTKRFNFPSRKKKRKKSKKSPRKRSSSCALKRSKSTPGGSAAASPERSLVRRPRVEGKSAKDRRWLEYRRSLSEKASREEERR